MKLLNVTNKYYIIIAVLLMLLGNGFLAYRVLNLVDNEISEHMLFEKQIIHEQIKSQPRLKTVPFEIGDYIEVIPIDRFTSFRINFKDTSMFDAYEGENIKFRMMTYEQEIDSLGYKITIRRRLTENKNILNGVFMTVALIGLDVLLMFYVLNKWFSKKVWAPFYHALEILKNFDLRKGNRTPFKSSDIEEFNILNEELEELTEKVSADYRNLKEFTENMSHETQTPLAIIRSRLDVLMQSENLTPQQYEQIWSTLEAVNRLSKMNRALILLAKIDNNQFADEELVDMKDLVLKQLSYLDPFIDSKALTVSTHFAENKTVMMNPQLSEILVSNILSNAIKYNRTEGMLKITLDRQSLQVQNTGDAAPIPAERIFERFKKSGKPDSVGLGLAIVKKICEQWDFQLNYSFVNNLHTFTVLFPKAPMTEETILA